MTSTSTEERSADAIRATRRRKRLLANDPLRYEQEKRQKAEHSRRRRREQAEAEGRVFRPRRGKYNYADLTSHQGLACDTNGSTVGESAETQAWSADILPSLGLNVGQQLPSEFVKRMEAVGRAIRAWELNISASSALAESFSGLPDTDDSMRSCIAELEKTWSMNLASGKYSHYAKLRDVIRRLQIAVTAGTSIIMDLNDALPACPRPHLIALQRTTMHYSNQVYKLRTLAYSLINVRESCILSSSHADVITFLRGTIEGAIPTGKVVAIPAYTALTLGRDHLGFFYSHQDLDNDVIDFITCLWNVEHEHQPFVILPTAFYRHFLANGVLKDASRAVKFGILNVAAQGRHKLWDKIIIPIRRSGRLFTAVVDTTSSRVRTYDSQEGLAWKEGQLQKLLETLIEFVHELCSINQWRRPSNKWTITPALDRIPQLNRTCQGVCALLVARHLSLANEFNHEEKVPRQYKCPPDATELDRARLILLEELLAKGTIVDSSDC
ncbi:hypothetical protein GGF50DRAFT_90300 [Schizophyllum commune]